MENQPTNPTINAIQRMLYNSGSLQAKPKQYIGSINAISRIIAAAALAFCLLFVYQLWSVFYGGGNNFTLFSTDIDIMPLKDKAPISFLFIGVYEVLKLLCIAVAFYFLFKFTQSLDIQNPFKNIQSKNYMNAFSKLAFLYFFIESATHLHIYLVSDLLQAKHTNSIFAWEYLFLAYFINAFAYIYRMGVDINNELDLVI